MKINIVTMMLMVCSFFAQAQSVPADPVPGCDDNLNRVGMHLPNGQNTQYFVAGIGINGGNENGSCEGVSSHIGWGELQPGEYAYGEFDADLIYELTPDMVDFSFDLDGVLASLSVGQFVKIAELNSTHSRIADLTLRKVFSPAAVVFNPKGKPSQGELFRWQLIVKWYGPLATLFTEESFLFDANAVVEYNYIADETDPDYPVSLISFGGDRVTVNPYDNQSVTQNIGATLLSGGLASYKLGIIETSDTLHLGDRISFLINWSINNAAVSQ